MPKELHALQPPQAMNLHFLLHCLSQGRHYSLCPLSQNYSKLMSFKNAHFLFIVPILQVEKICCPVSFLSGGEQNLGAVKYNENNLKRAIVEGVNELEMGCDRNGVVHNSGMENQIVYVFIYKWEVSYGHTKAYRVV